MSFRMKSFSASLAIAMFATVGLAQQPQTQTPNQKPDTQERQRPFGRGESRGFRDGHGPSGLFDPRLMRELNLTDAQRQQIQTIVQQNFDSSSEQREEMRQLIEKKMQGTLSADDEARLRTLREQRQASMKDTESKIAAVLTTEQKTKVEEIMKERREKREQFRGRRGGFPPSNQSTQPTQKPTVTPN